MGWNPKKANLSHSIDISNALDKAIEYLDNSDGEEPFVHITVDKPFGLQMRMYRYIKRIQGTDERKRGSG